MSAPRTLLIIDDEPHMRRLLQFALSKTGAKLLVAAGGAEAIALARGHPIDLVVTDFAMPEMDGFTATCELRKIPGCERVPVIMLTSRGQTDLPAAAMIVGVNLFLTKPFSPTELKQAVDRLLAAPPAAQ